MDSESSQRTRERKALWRKNNKDKVKSYSLKYRTSNAIAAQFSRAKHYYKDVEKSRAYHRNYTKENPEVRRLAETKYRMANREIMRAKYRRNYYRDLVKSKIRRQQYHYRRKAAMQNLDSDKSADGFIESVRISEFVRCEYCGVFLEGQTAHVEHKVPLSRGGPHIESNMCVSCRSCNISKGNKTPLEWMTWKQSYLERVKGAR